MTTTSINQRMEYLKELLYICTINRYGFSDEELLSLIAGIPTNKMIELLISLNNLADSKIKLYGVDECPNCADGSSFSVDTFSDNERRYRTAGT